MQTNFNHLTAILHSLHNDLKEFVPKHNISSAQQKQRKMVQATNRISDPIPCMCCDTGSFSCCSHDESKAVLQSNSMINLMASNTPTTSSVFLDTANVGTSLHRNVVRYNKFEMDDLTDLDYHDTFSLDQSCKETSFTPHNHSEPTLSKTIIADVVNNRKKKKSHSTSNLKDLSSSLMDRIKSMHNPAQVLMNKFK